MYNFILQTTLMLSLSLMIYLIARAAPRVSDEIVEKPQGGRIDKWFSRIPLERLDYLGANILEKFLRKLKLALMKWDNAVTNYLNKVKKLNGNGKENGENKFGLFKNGDEVNDS